LKESGKILRKSIKLASYIILLSLCSINISSASIYYDQGYDKISVTDESSANLKNIYDALHPSYGDTLISNKGNGLWYINRTVCVDRSTLNIKSPEVTELRITTEDSNWALFGTSTGNAAKGICIDGVKIVGYQNGVPDNRTNGRPKILVDKAHVSNTTFENFSIIDLKNGDNLTLQNITFRNLTGTVEIEASSNLTVKNIQADHLLKFHTYRVNNSAFSNIRVNDTIHDGDVLFEETNYSTFHDIIADGIGYPRPVAEGDGGGLNWRNCIHDTGYNISVNDTGWSGFAPGCQYGNWDNVTVRRAGHNGVDLHNIQDTIITNVSVYDSISNSFMITAGFVDHIWTNNITIKNVYSYNSGIVSDTGASNIYIENVTQEGSRNGMGINAVNFTVVNATFTPNNTWASMNVYNLGECNSSNITIIDASVYEINTDPGISNNKIINCKYQPGYCNNKAEYYYADIATRDEAENPIKGTVVFQNEINSLYSSINGLGKNKTVFYINSNGHTPLPNQNRLDSPAIAEGFSTAKITSSDNRTVSLLGIKPDSSWYRSDPNTPTYTITAIIPGDSDRTHIIGFAPSTDNPFSPGEKKTFRVWTDGNLTGMKWLVYNDNNEIVDNKTGVLNYTWTVSKDVSKIEFSGVDANGNKVPHTWYFGDESGDKTTNQTTSNSPTSDDNQTQVIKFFPEYTALTKNTGEPVTFSVKSIQPLTANWLINGKLVQNNTTTMVKSWNTSGTYNVTFSGSASGKSVLDSWFVYVIDSSNYHSLWDVKEDGIVDILDITSISRHYGEIYTNKPYPRWDVNQDGVINIQDLYLAGDHFGETVN